MNIVCIGRGHGLSQVLSALKTMPCSLTVIVTTTDNGGSTGRLRQDQSQIALGDIRRCVSALANQDNVEATTRRKANARLLESYGEMHRENDDLTTAISFSFKAFKEYPHKRHLKHLCSDLKRLAIMRVNALCQI